MEMFNTKNSYFHLLTHHLDVGFFPNRLVYIYAAIFWSAIDVRTPFLDIYKRKFFSSWRRPQIFPRGKRLKTQVKKIENFFM